MDKLNEALNQIESGDLYPFHMPGHKRQIPRDIWERVYTRDITEIDGYDNLHHAEGIIKEEQDFAARLFGAEESFYLINGSSCGVLAAICTVSQSKAHDVNDNKILMSRNAHKSAYNGLILFGMKADYLYPAQIKGLPFSGPVEVGRVKAALEKNEYKAVFITSPTYEGVISDIEKICHVAHQKGIPVIVDEAHGAHLGLWGGDGYFPESAIKKGADIVIQSLHKTLPAMTQTAILHVQGNLIDRQTLRLFLSMLQSSSPSYILMNSISTCLHDCKERGEEWIENYKRHLQNFYKEAEKLSYMQVFEPDKDIMKDPGKIIISATKCGLSGNALSDILRKKYHLEMEMAAKDYVIAMTSVMDTDAGFERLLSALRDLDAKGDEIPKEISNGIPQVESVISIKEALVRLAKKIPFAESTGQISKEFIYLYPPGIPVIAPGERMSQEIIAYLQEAKALGLQIQGPEDYLCREIYCIKED